MAQPKPLDSVAEPMRSALQQFAELIHSLAGDRAQGWTLYGAIARGVFDATRHTARSVLVVSEVNLAMLRRLAEHGPKLGKAHIAAPLIMTPKYIDASRDTFPLELIEIQQNHLVVFGEDYFAELSFEEADVRLQCERELKAMLIGMRQGLLAAAGREKVLAAMEVGAGETLLRTLRGLLWLRGRREAQPASAVLDEMENLAKRKLTGLRRSLDAAADRDTALFEQMYHDVEALGEMVDAW